MKDEIMKICETLCVEVYETPEIEAVLFGEDDVITTSGGGIIETPLIPIKPKNIW